MTIKKFYTILLAMLLLIVSMNTTIGLEAEENADMTNFSSETIEPVLDLEESDDIQKNIIYDDHESDDEASEDAVEPDKEFVEPEVKNDEGEDETGFLDDVKEHNPEVLGPIFGAAGMMRLMGFNTPIEYEDTIAVTKTAERTKKDNGDLCGCRSFEVTLGITGTPPEKPVDVVLVLDRSGSMEGTRMTQAKTSAKNFAEVVLGNGNPNDNRMALVSYATSAVKNVGWTENLTGNLGIKTAINGLKAAGWTNIEDGFIKAESLIDSARPNANKVIVLLSDGEANRSVNSASSPYPAGHNKHTKAAYLKGQALQSKAAIYTIGLALSNSPVGTETLKWSAPTGNFYDSPDVSDLEDIYDEIATKLNYSAQNAVVVDKIGPNFEPVLPLPAGATYDASTREITWEPGTIVNSAQYKYEVVAISGFVGGLADTNEYARLNYTDVNGETAEPKEFPVPEVDVPTVINVILTDATITIGETIVLGSGIDSSGDNYMSPITGGDNDNSTFTYEWRVAGNQTIISTDKNPEVAPIVETKYEVTVTDSNGCIAVAFMTVFVTEPTVDITANKVWVGGPTVKPTIELQLYQGTQAYGSIVALANGVTSKTWNDLPKLDGAGNEYVYTVKEVTTPENYLKDETGLTVTNTYVSPKIDVTANKIWVKGPEDKPDIQFELYRNNVKIAGPVTLINGVTSYTWIDMDKTDNNGENYTYTVKEIGSLGNYTKEEIGLTVTNTFTSPKIDIDVTKLWVGLPAESVTVNLVGADVDPLILNKANSWSGSFNDLFKYNEDGELISYTVSELELDGYTTKVTGSIEDGFIITNTIDDIDALIDLPVVKKWVGKAAEEVTITLNGADVEPLVLSESNNWSDSFKGLRKYHSETGLAIEYTIEETPLDGYTTNIENSINGGFTITNTIADIDDKISIDVEKIWYGPVGPEVTVHLISAANSEDLAGTVVLNADNDWTHTFANLDKYTANGMEIKYTVEENSIENYETKIIGSMEEGFRVENYNTETVKVDVEKIWRGKVAESVEIEIYDEAYPDLSVADSIVLNLDNNWKHSFEELPKYTVSGELSKYKVKEISMDDYLTIVEGNMYDGYKITNIEKIDITVNKKWHGYEGEQVIINLIGAADSEDLAGSVVLNADNDWTHTFSGLPKYTKAGSEIDYTVEEVYQGYYNHYIDGSIEEGFTVTNIEALSLYVYKEWIGPKVDSVTITLYADGDITDKTITLSEDNYWSDTFDRLDMYNAEGELIEYTIKENAILNYKSVITDEVEGYGFLVTNTYVPPVDPTTSITANKVWVGGPEVKPTIELQLYRNELKYGEPVQLVNGVTSYTWTNLPDGSNYEYTAKEVEVPENYDMELSADGLTITNTFFEIKGENREVIDITGRKVWVGGPEVKPTIELQLYRNDIPLMGKITLEDGMLEYTWKDLFKTDEDGKDYKYTIKEVEVPENYDMEVSADGLTITNTYFEIKGAHVPIKAGPTIPNTGIKNNQVFFTTLLLVSGVILIGLAKKRKTINISNK